MYKIQGLKKSGKELDLDYSDYNIAKFEFECMQLNNISQYLVLYKVEGTGMQQIDLYINN
jgi:hypothetical protein